LGSTLPAGITEEVVARDSESLRWAEETKNCWSNDDDKTAGQKLLEIDQTPKV